MYGWSEPEWHTLQLGPLWVVEALLGRNRLSQPEESAFWRAVDDAPAADEVALPWLLTQAMNRNRDWLLAEFALDDRSIVSGLSEVTTLLERVEPETSRATREAILRVGSGLAKARGPFGQQIGNADAQTLQIVAQLLESSAETALNNPLNAAIAI